jgi:hypothetical protein
MGLGFMGLGFMGLGFMGLGFMGLGFMGCDPRIAWRHGRSARAHHSDCDASPSPKPATIEPIDVASK